MVWIFAALAHSLLAAANAEINRIFQQEPFRLNLVRTTLASLIWLPVALVQPWPTEQMFYITAVFSGVAIVFGNLVLNDLSRRMCGRVAALHIPLKAILVLLAWPLVDEAAMQHLLHEEPWQMVTGLMFFGIMVAALNAMRRNDASWGALKVLLPVILFYTFADIAARLQLQGENFGQLLVVYLFVAMSVSAVFSILLLPFRPNPEKPLVSKKLFQAAGWAAAITMTNHICFFIGLTLAPNPAFVSMLGLMAPAWLMLYHRIFNIKDDANPWAGLVLVLGSLGLLVVTH
ncbi:MAG: hypothetical protein H6922_04725 [Pseudomonadaceae bacterium]|nr:hypothetical protein [Pseudomonadaceae bacterium]